MRLVLVMTPVPVMDPAVVAVLAVVAVEAATLVSSEPFSAGRKPAAVVWISCDTPLKVFPCVVIFAVVTPLTAVAESEPPESVAVLNEPPVTAPVTAKLLSVPTDVMFV